MEGSILDALSGASSALNVVDKSIKASQAAAAFVRVRRTRSANADRFLKILNLGPDTARAFRISATHPIHDSSPYVGADLFALEAISDPAIVAAELDDFGLWDDDVRTDLENDIVLIGSPESEPLTRLVFGYEELPNAAGTAYLGGTIPLVYGWEEELSRCEVLCVHNRAVGHVAIRPNWPLVVRQPELKYEWPHLGKGNYLEEDFLIITKIPNFLSDRALQSGYSMVSIAGLHGVGTRAIGTLLDTKNASVLQDVLERLEVALRSSPWFQVVIKVTSIDHQDQRGSMPLAVTCRDVVSLDLPQRVIKQAQEVIVSRIDGWLTTEKSPAGRAKGTRLGFDLHRPFSPEEQAVFRAIGGT